MKPIVAWVVYDLPYPPSSGGKLRAYNLIKYLSQDFEIDLYSFYRNSSQLTHLVEFKKFCREVKTYRRNYVWSPINLFRALFSSKPLLNVSYSNGQLEKDLLSAVRRKEYSLVHFEFFGVSNLLPNVSKMGVKTVLGEENVEYSIYKNYTVKQSRSLLYPLFLYDVWKMKKKEEYLWENSDLNLAVSASDAEVIEKSCGRRPVLVPNGVEIPLKGFDPFRGSNPIKTNNKAFFAGDLNYQQNRNALFWFLSQILPKIKKEIPGFKVVVLSRVRPRFINKYEESVEMVVDSESPFEKFVNDVTLFISPILIKSGTNIKVLQAAANFLPIVGTPASFVGYEFENEMDVLMAQDAEDFARKVIRLFKNRKLQDRLSKNAFNKVQKYRWENSAKILKDAYFSILP